jgi:hypothetical protein
MQVFAQSYKKSCERTAKTKWDERVDAPKIFGRSMRAVVLLIAAVTLAAADVETEEDIKKRVLANYAVYGGLSVRPSVAEAARALVAANSGDGCMPDMQPDMGASAPPDKVETQVYVDRLHSLDQREQTFGFEGYLRSWWRDSRLAYNASARAWWRNSALNFPDMPGDEACEPSELSLTREESASVWRPDFYWEKALSIKLPKSGFGFDSGAGQSFFVYPDGSVFVRSAPSLTRTFTLCEPPFFACADGSVSVRHAPSQSR